MQVGKSQILQLPVNPVQAQAVRNRCVYFQRFRGDARPFVTCQVIQRAHVVRAVGQFDEDDPHIARHRQQHFAERLGLVFLPRREVQLVQFGQAVHQLGDRRAEALDQLDLGDAAIFQCVMQERGHQRLGVEFPVSALGGDSNRMGDVGFAAVAYLSQMGFVGKFVGLANPLDVYWRQIVQFGHEGGKTGCCRVNLRRTCRSGTWRLARTPGRRGRGTDGSAHPSNIACG